MSEQLRVMIGFDRRQPVAFHVLAHSIMTYASRPISITPLLLDQMPKEFGARKGLTEFTFSRFLVPWLCGFEGKALFLDSDMLAKKDLAPLLDAPMEGAVAVRNNFPPQLQFERMAVALFNCARCTKLTPEYVATATVSDLYGLKWADSIESLSPMWHVLAGYEDTPTTVGIWHFTQGIPCHPETQSSPGAYAWKQEHRAVVSAGSYQAIMGGSVHVVKAPNGFALPKFLFRQPPGEPAEADAA